MMESIHGVGYWAIKGENSAGNSCFSYFFSQGYGFDKYYQCLLLKAKVNFSLEVMASTFTSLFTSP